MCARTQVHKYKIHTLLHTTSTQHKQHKPTRRHTKQTFQICVHGVLPELACNRTYTHTWISSQMRLRAQSYAHIYLHTQTQHVKRYTYISAEVQTHLQTTQTPQAHRNTHTNTTDALHTKTDRQIDRHLCTGVPTLTHTYLQTANTLSMH